MQKFGQNTPSIQNSEKKNMWQKTKDFARKKLFRVMLPLAAGIMFLSINTQGAQAAQSTRFKVEYKMDGKGMQIDLRNKDNAKTARDGGLSGAMKGALMSDSTFTSIKMADAFVAKYVAEVGKYNLSKSKNISVFTASELKDSTITIPGYVLDSAKAYAHNALNAPKNANKQISNASKKVSNKGNLASNAKKAGKSNKVNARLDKIENTLIDMQEQLLQLNKNNAPADVNQAKVEKRTGHRDTLIMKEGPVTAPKKQELSLPSTTNTVEPTIKYDTIIGTKEITIPATKGIKQKAREAKEKAKLRATEQKKIAKEKINGAPEKKIMVPDTIFKKHDGSKLEFAPAGHENAIKQSDVNLAQSDILYTQIMALKNRADLEQKKKNRQRINLG